MPVTDAPWVGQPGDVLLPKPENLARWYGRRGHHEVWYATTNHRPSRTGLWFRYTLHAPRGDAEAPTASVWGFAFTPDGPSFAAKRTVAVAEAGISSNGAVLDGVLGRLAEDGMRGEVSDDGGRTMRWDLSFEPDDRVTGPLPPLLEGRAPSYYCNPNLDVRASGRVEVDGAVLNVEDEPLGQSHIWGAHHAGRWAWMHLHVSDGFVVEALQARPHLAAGVGERLPTVPFAVVRLAGRDQRFGASPRARTSGRFAFPTWHLSCTAPGLRIAVTVHAPPERFVQVTYHDPDGSPSYCTNTEVADATVDVYRRHAGSWRTVESHHLDGCAHVEFGARTPCPQVPVTL